MGLIRHYTPKGTKEKMVASTEEVKGAGKVFSDFIKASETDDPQTLIDIKITNPLRKLYELLQEIKKHQSTTFSLKFTIPLIALPIFLFAAFQLGRGQQNCTQAFSSKLGTIKNITVEVPVNAGRLSKVREWFSFLPGSVLETHYIEEEQTILLDGNGNTINISHPAYVVTKRYEGANVLVSGNYSSCTQVLTLISEKNIVPVQ